MKRPPTTAPLLALDTGSPLVSLALGRPGEPAACRTLEQRLTSEQMLPAAREMLDEAGLHAEELGGIVALAGPGSFTGLRIGLATALGLHQALGLPATALATLEVLALAAAADLDDGDVVVAAVDALRGEWMVQSFAFEGGEPQPLDEPTLSETEPLVRAGRPLIGFRLEALAAAGDGRQQVLEPPPLAPLAIVAASRASWDPGTLVQPIYFRPPAAKPAAT